MGSDNYQFPNEPAESARVRANLAREFNYASRLLDFWVAAEKDYWLTKSGLPDMVLHLAMALHTQACRQMRTIIEECSRCEAFGAEIAARCLFETVLALIFVTKPKVHIITLPDLDKQTKQQKKTATGLLRFTVRLPDKKHRRTKATLLSQELRANLYMANFLFQQQAHARKCRNTPRAKKVGRELEALIDPRQVKHAESLIGPIWTYILREEKTYSGLAVADLSRLLDRDLFQWYVKFYGPQSSLVHGASAVIHTQRNDDNTIGSAFLSSQDEVQRLLMIGSILFCILMAEMQKYIGFGPEIGSRVEELRQEFLQWFRTEPPH